ncbi:hypothetical protein B566_EDAN018698 [Ephemera danica]|nr:hypothetical protein B566_EDAN018698 [Ephemera danica]
MPNYNLPTQLHLNDFYANSGKTFWGETGYYIEPARMMKQRSNTGPSAATMLRETSMMHQQFTFKLRRTPVLLY